MAQNESALDANYTLPAHKPLPGIGNSVYNGAVEETVVCRIGCGACCIALSISSPLPGMARGKPAGVRCVQLTDDNRCRIYAQRPAVCRRLRPSREMCGETREDALRYFAALERATAPKGNPPHLDAPADDSAKKVVL